MRTPFRALPFCVLALLASATAHATGVPDYLTARGIALGGTRALGFGNEAIFLNPAGMLVNKQYTLQLDYGHATSPNEQLTSGNGLVVSIGDSSTNPRIATGIAYRYASLEAGGQTRRGSITDFLMATPLSDMLFVGMKISYLSFSDGTNDVKKWTGDLGLTLNLDSIVISTVGFNLLSVNSPESARGISAGIAYTNHSNLSIGGDVRWQFIDKKAPRTYAAGAEYVIADMFPLRLGFISDGIVSAKFLTAGTGFYMSQFGLDVTYRRNLATGEGIWMFAAKVFGAGG